MMEKLHMLRPWQAVFLKDEFGIDTVSHFVSIYNNCPIAVLIQCMRKWLQENISDINEEVDETTCEISLHMWVRSCTAFSDNRSEPLTAPLPDSKEIRDPFTIDDITPSRGDNEKQQPKNTTDSCLHLLKQNRNFGEMSAHQDISSSKPYKQPLGNVVKAFEEDDLSFIA